jgi:hypothetical protein
MSSSRLITICIICVLTQTNCNDNSSDKKLIFNGIPRHELFVNKNLIWGNFSTDTDYYKKVGSKDIDTMIILTADKMLFITGQYGLLSNDTTVMPFSGEFGINYEVLENTKYRLSIDTLITIGQQQFIKKTKAEFQWWNEIIPQIKTLGKGSVIVSGP